MMAPRAVEGQRLGSSRTLTKAARVLKEGREKVIGAGKEE
jgi:hypothetical protein